ncbi:MAG: hypothetical protein CL596_05250 [Alteromonas sp.]|nr:hypothetical protein [Alteromonas sp.]|tara:strand:- start:7546 stop:7860 length:315 start_codon:yes stop_codon:yes gene_type:complete
MITFSTDLIWSQPNPYPGKNIDKTPPMPKQSKKESKEELEKKLFITCKYAVDISKKVSEPITMEVSHRYIDYITIIVYPNQRPEDLHKIILLTREIKELKNEKL